MSLIALILLFIIAYLCAKSVRNIWRNSFGATSRKSKDQHRQSARSSSSKKQKQQDSPIQKGEGDYVDYEEV